MDAVAAFRRHIQDEVGSFRHRGRRRKVSTRRAWWVLEGLALVPFVVGASGKVRCFPACG